MAGYSACFPVFSPIVTPYNATTPSAAVYGVGAVLGKMMSVSINPAYRQSTRLGNFVNSFDSAAVALNTTVLSSTAFSKMFGDYGGEEQGIPGGFGFIEGIIDSGVRSYRVHWIKQIVFTPPPLSAVSTGDSVSFTTPAINGIAWDDGSGKWCDDPVDKSTITEAIAYLKTKAGIV